MIKMVKLRMVCIGEIYFKNQDRLRKPEKDLRKKAVMPKVLSLCATWE